MKIINDTKQERLITIELTEKELNSIIAAIGETSYSETENFFDNKNIKGLDKDSYQSFYNILSNYQNIKF